MTTEYTGWRRDKEGLGLWDGQGKVAIVGWGQSPVDRRWDGASMDKTYGAYAIQALQRTIEDSGITPDEIDGLMANLLVSDSQPTGHTRLSDWLDEHADSLGRGYVSELERHYR
ncbi:MAG: hypothetical protein IIC84_00550 [Chloroflexi bacterium]|nr:hypothetical protein [Chloroflexota bacterium]